MVDVYVGRDSVGLEEEGLAAELKICETCPSRGPGVRPPRQGKERRCARRCERRRRRGDRQCEHRHISGRAVVAEEHDLPGYRERLDRREIPGHSELMCPT